MSLSITYRKAEPGDLAHIEDLLRRSDLPVSDLHESKVDFIVATNNDNRLAGCIGIECHGKNGLLRSFAVDPSWRNRQIGHRLLNELLSYSRTKNIQQLHLLTTTAEKYFEKAGFTRIEREDAPLSIRSTTEFSSICPATSAYMMKKNILLPL